MIAAVVEKYGPPEIIQIKEVEIPEIADDEMLVKVYASSINTTDTTARSGIIALFGLTRLMMGIRKPKESSTGTDVAGEIVKVGKDITKFKVGDKVFGLSRTGSAAEFAKTSERGIAIKPESMTYKEAAAIPVAALTALQYLRDLGNIRDGLDILIYGASGGIGTYAIQYAKTFNVKVTGVCSGKNMDFVKDLGADEVLDYTKQDFTKLSNKYDIIFDTVGKSPQRRWKKALKKDGIFLQAGSPNMRLGMMFIRVLGNKFRSKKMKFLIAKSNNADLSFLASLVDDGKMKSVIDKEYSLDELVEAHKYYETGRTKGKVVINILE